MDAQQAQILSMLLVVLANFLHVEARHLSAGLTLRHDLALDSLDRVALAISIEDRFEVVIPDEVIHHAGSLSDLVHYIDRRVLPAVLLT